MGGHMRLGLVLGGGGVVGIAYHAGVLQALADCWGLEPDDAEVVIGTSAGSVVGAYLRSGRDPHQLVAEVLGDATTAPSRPLPAVLDWAGASPLSWVRRTVGTAFVAGRSLGRALPIPPPPAVLRRAFPAGLAAMAEAKQRLRADLPAAWPDRPLWLTAVDLVSGRRMVLGRDGGHRRLSLPDAVRASCAIPVVYPPVPCGRRLLVDGGLHSSANLDLVAEADVDAVIGVLPMAYDPLAPPRRVEALSRRPGSRTLGREIERVRRAGASVLLVRPDATVVRAQGPNLMRTDGLPAVVRAAYEATCRQLESADRHVASVREVVAA